jgi:hypothetical protein
VIDADWHTYRILVQGNVIRVLLDGTLVIETTNNRYLSPGQVGVWSHGAEVNIRRVSVIALGGSGSANPAPASTVQAQTAEGAEGVPADIPPIQSTTDTYSGGLAALLPTEPDVPQQPLMADERNRSLNQFAENYINLSKTVAIFEGWGVTGQCHPGVQHARRRSLAAGRGRGRLRRHPRVLHAGERAGCARLLTR